MLNAEHGVRSVGPWGNHYYDDSLWDDGVYSAIRKVIVTCDNTICSIEVEYDKNGSSVWSRLHGKPVTNNVHQIKMDPPNEFLTSINGYYGSRGILSLTFVTNLRRYGPYGSREIGKYFSSPVTAGKIVGFHGNWFNGYRISNLSAIGVHITQDIARIKNNQAESFLSIGPWGSQLGSSWDDGVYSGVKTVIVSGHTLSSIEIEYDMNGISVWSGVHGDKINKSAYQINIDHPNEFLTSINGYCGATFVASLTFVTNLRTYGPYGEKIGTYFSSPATVGKIVGFHGKVSGLLRSAIGVHIKPLQDNNLQSESHNIRTPSIVKAASFRQKDILSPSFTAAENQNQNRSPSSREKDVKASPKAESRVASHGPWGGPGGSLFDDGYYTGIRQINLSHDEAIRTIKVCYDKDGKVAWRTTRGDGGGDRFNKVIFDYPVERLKRITGTYGPVMNRGPIVILSISFHTNRRKYGPFGIETGSPFASGVYASSVDVRKSERIVGFYGRESLYLEAIGVHVHVGQVGSSDLSDEEPEEKNMGIVQELKRERSNPNLSNRLYYRSFRITNFWGYH